MSAEWIPRVVSDIANMDDRNSPEDWPEAMLVTADELTEIIDRHFSESMASAARDVLAERNRQIKAEGWTPEHDDAHKNGSLSRAGGFYALNAGAAMWYGTTDTTICDAAPDGWPWAPEWWKPSEARRDLVKAAALILAEIERLDRIQPPKGGG